MKSFRDSFTPLRFSKRCAIWIWNAISLLVLVLKPNICEMRQTARRTIEFFFRRFVTHVYDAHGFTVLNEYGLRAKCRDEFMHAWFLFSIAMRWILICIWFDHNTPNDKCETRTSHTGLCMARYYAIRNRISIQTTTNLRVVHFIVCV